MSRERLEDLLQSCLTAYESGLTPEECLAAYPQHRNLLEPLLRQALSLRVAFAHAPSEAFRERAREKLLFAAGRDVKIALAAEPKTDFVADARQRFILAAGAEAQEALRNVPPPRLPFWWNARRRLLEAAAAPRPRLQPMAIAMRMSLSAAVVVLAIAVAGLAFLTSQSQSQSVSAQIDALEEQLDEVEEQTAAGEPVSATVLVELTRRTHDIIIRLNEQPQGPLAIKLPDIIDRQQYVVQQAVIESPAPQPELVQAQIQLEAAEELVRTFAVRIETPTSVPATNTPLATATARTTPTAVPSPTATAVPVQANQVRIRLLQSDNTLGLNWTQIETSNLNFVIPSTWKVVGVVLDVNGIATLETPFLRIDSPATTVIVNTRTAELRGLIDDQWLELRSEGRNGKTIELTELFAKAGDVAPHLYHMIESLQITGSVSTTATPTTSPGPRTPTVSP